MKLYNQCVLLLVVDKQTIDCLPISIQKDIIKMRVYFKLWYKCYHSAMDFSSKTLKLRMTLKCDKCGNAYANHFNLKYHIESCTGSQEKKPCDCST